MRWISRRRHDHASHVRAPWALVVLSIAAFVIALIAGPVEAQGGAQAQPQASGAQAAGAQPSVSQAAVSQASLVLDLQTHSGPIRRLAVDPEGRTVVTASDDKTAIVWNLADGRARHVLRVPVGSGEVGRLYAAAIDPSGKTVAVAGTSAAPGGAHRIYLFDLATGGFVRTFDARGGDIKRMAWGPEGLFLAAVYAGEPALRVFDSLGAMWASERLPADSYGLSVSAQGQIAVASFDRQVRLYRIRGGRLEDQGVIRTTLNDPVSVRHSPDGRWVAVGYFSLADIVDGNAPLMTKGESGAVRRRALVDVFGTTSRTLERSIEFRDLAFGNLMTVAWQHDGSALYAGGTGYAREGEHPIKRIPWPQGEPTSVVVASDSILDMAALPQSADMLFASYDGSWGVLGADGNVRRHVPTTQRLVDAQALRVSADARSVEWRPGMVQRGAAQPEMRSFVLPERRAGTALASGPAADALRSPVDNDRPAFIVEGMRANFAPSVNGVPVAMLPNEAARAAALLPDRSAVMLATSRTLRRVGSDGREQWRLAMHTEARAVNVSADGRLVVAGLGDGSIRWYRAADGAPLLSLVVLGDGRWIVWTESGHFDAGPGAEDLVGWLVTRPSGERADFHGASRFRARFMRPDIIDQVLVQADVPRAITLANQARRAQALAINDDDLIAAVDARQQDVPATQTLPAALTLASAAPAVVDTDKVDLEVAVFAPADAQGGRLQARVDGRPVTLEVKRLEPRPGGEVMAQVSVQLVTPAGRLTITSEGRNGHSMPLALDVRSTAPALAERKRGSLYVLSVGVSRYSNPVINLLQASKDARDFAASMRKQEGVSAAPGRSEAADAPPRGAASASERGGPLYDQVQARVIVDEGATQAAMLDGLNWLARTPGRDDTAVLFIAGHGVVDATDTYYFLPHDMREARLARTAVSEAQLRDTMAGIQGRALFFIDTCFASRALGDLGKQGSLDRRETGRMASGLSQSELGVIVFSGSAPRQESLETTAWGNGAFTKALVEGLSGLADPSRKGFVTHVGLDGYVSEAVRTLTRGRQTPVTAVPPGVADFPVARWSVSSAP
jgi:Caspase domain/WD domain, G-beta repeat